MSEHPQVVLFGSISGGWRESIVIPVLEALGVTYFNPVGEKWTPEMGHREAEAMKYCETIVIVINGLTPAFTGLAESGWAALGAQHRGQTFIFCVLPEYYKKPLPLYLRWSRFVRDLVGYYEHTSKSMRYLMLEHAKRFSMEHMIVVEDMDGVLDALRNRYEETISQD